LKMPGCSVILYSLVVLLSFVDAFLPRTIKRCDDIGNYNYQKVIFRDTTCFAKARKKENKKSSALDDDLDDNAFDGFSDDVKELLLSAKDLTENALLSTPSPLVTGEPISVDDEDLGDEGIETDDDLRKYVQDITGMLAEMDDESSYGDYVTSPDDIVGEEYDEDESLSQPNVVTSNDWREKVQTIMKEVIKKQGLYVQKIFWVGGRVEVVISASDDPANPVGPSVSALQICHRSMYDEFELREEELAVVTKFEIVVASPGIGEVLRTDQDFVSFKGFNVAVTTKEIYKKKTLFEGTLVERNEHDVCISLKGRIVKVPRDLVAAVRLPKPKYESTDTEMKKLR
jgi:ribosome maturation factor RimP